MRYKMVAVMAVTLLLSACGTMQQLSELPTHQVPSECLQACPELPEPYAEDDLAVVLWTFDVIEAAGQCRRMHEACRKSK